MPITQAAQNAISHPARAHPGAILAIVLAFGQRRGRGMLLGLHILALMIVAMVYFGDTRLRVPYDGLLIVLAVDAYACGYRLLRRTALSLWRTKVRPLWDG